MIRRLHIAESSFLNLLSSSCAFKVKTVWAGTGLSAALLSYSLDAHPSIANLNGYRKYLANQTSQPAMQTQSGNVLNDTLH